ncbi:reverse transcriptase domain-containing protein [Tanacetum coccineum]
MHTRSQSRNLLHQQHQAPPPVVEPFNLEEPIENPAPPLAPMDDTRTMAQLLEAPTAGTGEHPLLMDMTKKIPLPTTDYYNKITSTMKFPNVPSTSVKLMLFPFSLEGAAQIWLEKEPPRSIQTWDDLVSKFINKFFPPSKTTNLRNEITRFQQRFDETFYEAWDRFNDLLRACPHHGFSELHQLDTFYNALNSNDQDSLNSAAGGNFLDKMPRDCLRIIESKSKVRNSRNKPVVAKVSSSTSTPGISSDVAELKDMVKALLLDKKNQSPAPTPVKAVEESCVTCGGAHSYQTCPATTAMFIEIKIPRICVQPPALSSSPYQALAPIIKVYRRKISKAYVKANEASDEDMQTQGQNMQKQLTKHTDMLSNFVTSNTSSTSGTHPRTLLLTRKRDLKGIYHSEVLVAYKGTPRFIQLPLLNPANALVSASMPNQKHQFHFPSRRIDERRREKANDQIEKFYKSFRDLSFELALRILEA